MVYTNIDTISRNPMAILIILHMNVRNNAAVGFTPFSMMCNRSTRISRRDSK
jgi:hypothetical protein